MTPPYIKLFMVIRTFNGKKLLKLSNLLLRKILLKHLNDGKKHDFAKFAIDVYFIECLPPPRNLTHAQIFYFGTSLNSYEYVFSIKQRKKGRVSISTISIKGKLSPGVSPFER